MLFCNNKPILIYIVFFIGKCMADNETYFEETKDYIKNVGEKVVLECTAHNPNGYQISWIKDNERDDMLKTLLAVDRYCVANSPRFYLNVYDETRYELTILELEESDSGLYQCTIFLPDKSRVTANMKLKVVPKTIFAADTNK